MRYLLRGRGFCVVAAVLLSGCGDQPAPNPVWKTMCEAFCTRGMECFSDASTSVCVSLCLDEFGSIPCEADPQLLDECVAGIASLSCEVVEEGEFPPVCAHMCTGGLCEGINCDDGNECTDDVCDPRDGSCDREPFPDGTPCSGGGCENAVCTSVFSCTEQGIGSAISAGGGSYTFACNGPTRITTTEPIAIDNDVILDGEGNLTVDGDGRHRVLSVHDVVTAELLNMSVTGGYAQQGGSGLSNGGMLTLMNVSVSDNSGAGILNSGTVLAIDSASSNNTGSGILNYGTATLSKCRVSANLKNGIDNNGTLTLNDSIVSSNVKHGIYSYSGEDPPSDTGVLVMSTSTVSGNSAYGIVSEVASIATLRNSTVSGNVGGLDNWGALTVTNCTVSGKIQNRSVGTSTLAGSLVDGDCEGAMTSGGYNIESPGDTCGFDQEGDQANVSAELLNLGALADNDGPTMTHKPGDGGFGEGSAALDQIPEADCKVATDQRGQPRPAGTDSKCDVGSLEVQEEEP